MTTLDERRIERMRGVVMDAVDADVRRRGLRTRVLVRSGAVVCALAIVGGVGAQVANGHGGTSGANFAFEHGGAVRRIGAAAPDFRSDAVGTAAPAAPAAPASLAPQQSGGRSIITTGSAHVVTETPLMTSENFIAWVESAGGRVAGQYDTGLGRRANVSLTVRVPNAEAAITRLRSLGRVLRVDTNARDVTGQATDLDARITETRISIARLEAILARTSSVRNVLIAERALTTRQQQLESMVERRKSLSGQVALATLNVTFAPNRKVAHSSDWFHRTFVRGLDAFASAVNALLVAFGYLLPWLVAACLIALIWLGVLRLARRRP